MALFRSIATVSGWTLVSRFLGFARTMLMAHVLGVGMIADAFLIAFKFANFFRRLFAEGAFNAAFVPMFSGKMTTDGREPAIQFAAEAAAVLGGGFLIFTMAAILTMPWLMLVIAPGFLDDPEKFALTVDLTRVIFPYCLFMVLVALMGGMLNSIQRFAATSAAPVFQNVVLISILAALSAGYLSAPEYALALGVSAAGLIQLLWIAYACKRAGFLFKIPRPRLTPGVRRLLGLMSPALVGSGAVQINLIIDVILASTLVGGSISFLYYADRVYQLPLAVVGIAVGIALLPLLTYQLRAGEFDAAQSSQNRAIEFVLLLTLPAAAALMVISRPIVTVLFQHGTFGAAAVDATAGALSAYAMGLPAYVLIRALTPGYFAREDTRTPVKIAVATMIANVALAVVLMQFLAHVGIALATAVAAWFNAGFLASILVRRGHLEIDRRLRRGFPRLVLATAAMAAALWWANGQLASMLAGGDGWSIVGLAILVCGGAAVFAVLAVITGAVRLADLKAPLKR